MMRSGGMKVLLYGVMAFWLAFCAVAVVDVHAAAQIVALVHHG